MGLPIMNEFASVEDRSMYDEANEHDPAFEAPPGLNEEVVRTISKSKNEPAWMLEKRLQGLKLWQETGFPKWGPDLSALIKDIDKIKFFVQPKAKETTNWEDLPEDIRKTYEKIGIPEAEKKSLSGVGAQYDSEILYHNLKKEWEDQGVVFTNMDVAVKKYPEIVKKYFMTSCIPINDHKFIMLHASVWSGGTFIMIPKNVKVRIPLQAYFRMNAEFGGQFEHTLIIADEGSEVHYIEGCFTEGNMVTTNPDYKKIKDIREEEKVLTSEGDFKKTEQMQQSLYSGDLYTIEFYGDSTQKIEVTEEHPFLYVDRKRKSDRNKEWNPRWNMPKFFKKGDYLTAPINARTDTLETIKFYIKRSNAHTGKGTRGFSYWEWNVPAIPEFFRLVGYYLAEGSISSGHYLNFSFNMNEREYIEDVKQCVQKVFGVTKSLETHHKKNNGTNVVFCDTDLARLFSHFGKGCDKKHIYSTLMYAPKDLQRELIKGWFRGDGNYYNKQHKSGRKELFRINTVSEKLARQGKDILLRLGIVSFLNARDRAKEGRRKMYTLGISGDQMIPFGEIAGISVSSTMNGKKRAGKFGLTEKFAFYPIKKITKRAVENHPVYNFGVDDDHTYTVGGVAVHNCSAPSYNSSALHAGCVELHVLKNARIRYSSVENWSRNTYNLNTKRAIVHEGGVVEWINGNIGSGCTMLYPCSVLAGRGARSDSLGIAFAGDGQNQDTGSKVIHAAPETSSTITAKSISKDSGISTYRGLVKVMPAAVNSKVSVECDALLIGEDSTSNTYPQMEIGNNKVDIAHEATVGKIGTDEIFYLMSRGLSEEEARQMVVAGFIEPIVKALPLEYSVELNKLIELEMEGSVG
ncbi:MAG: SufD family Fe-S cluster assembly protein [Candidatus Woesearchaeota archaeon]|nr:SufD family Fe-S cluster assembly protein [Candidatus Woesearchaeota archaeon]